jgi:hypothetical protein
VTDRATKVTAALDEAEDQTHVLRARSALESWVADRSISRRDDLMFWLTQALGEQQAMDLLGMKPPRKGLVYCCSTIGWVTEAERFDHRWDAYSDMD